MHFATAISKKFDFNSSVCCVNYEGAHALLLEKIKEELKKEGANPFTMELLARAVYSLLGFNS